MIALSVTPKPLTTNASNAKSAHQIHLRPSAQDAQKEISSTSTMDTTKSVKTAQSLQIAPSARRILAKSVRTASDYTKANAFPAATSHTASNVPLLIRKNVTNATTMSQTSTQKAHAQIAEPKWAGNQMVKADASVTTSSTPSTATNVSNVTSSSQDAKLVVQRRPNPKVRVESYLSRSAMTQL